jgi:hypothetical protein
MEFKCAHPRWLIITLTCRSRQLNLLQFLRRGGRQGRRQEAGAGGRSGGRNRKDEGGRMKAEGGRAQLRLLLRMLERSIFRLHSSAFILPTSSFLLLPPSVACLFNSANAPQSTRPSIDFAQPVTPLLFQASSASTTHQVDGMHVAERKNCVGHFSRKGMEHEKSRFISTGRSPGTRRRDDGRSVKLS